MDLKIVANQLNQGEDIDELAESDNFSDDMEWDGNVQSNQFELIVDNTETNSTTSQSISKVHLIF